MAHARRAPSNRWLLGAAILAAIGVLCASVVTQVSAWRADLALATRSVEATTALVSLWLDGEVPQTGWSDGTCEHCTRALHIRLAAFELPEGISIAVTDLDGLLIARQPDVGGAVGRVFRTGMVGRLIASEAERPDLLEVWDSPVDGKRRVYHGTRHPTLPFWIVTGTDYEPIRTSARERFVVHAGFVLLVWFLGFGLVRTLLRVQVAQARAVDRNLALSREVLVRAAAEENARRRLAEQTLVSQVSETLLHATWDDLAFALSEHLEAIATHFAVDRAWVMLVDPVRRVFEVAYEGAVNGVVSNANVVVGLRLDDFPFVDHTIRGGGMTVRDVDDRNEWSSALSDEERAFIASVGTRGLHMLALTIREEHVGVFGLDTAARPLAMSAESAAVFVTLRDIIAATLARLRRERELELSELRFRAIFDSAGSAAIRGYDTDLRVILWNERSRALYGYEPTALEPTAQWERFPVVNQTAYAEAIGSMIETGQVGPAQELVLQPAADAQRYVLAHHILVDVPGRGRELYCVDVDLTEQKRLETRLREQATTDELTGLANRRYFMERARTELQRVRRHGGNAAVLLIDIDYFKRVNDTYGHAAGDQVLITLARRLTERVRDADLVSRLGGEEFALLLPRTSVEAAAQLAERLRVENGAEPYLVDGVTIEVTFSVGVAATTSTTCDVETLLREADRALYEAKNAGRDRVVTA
jgi:diguanylate cyclase (GGDEF)-like protein